MEIRCGTEMQADSKQENEKETAMISHLLTKNFPEIEWLGTKLQTYKHKQSNMKITVL